MGTVLSVKEKGIEDEDQKAKSNHSSKNCNPPSNIQFSNPDPNY